MLHRILNIARQVFYPQVAHRNAEVVSGHIFQFVRLIENDGSGFWQNARVRRASACNLIARSAKNR